MSFWYAKWNAQFNNVPKRWIKNLNFTFFWVTIFGIMRKKSCTNTEVQKNILKIKRFKQNRFLLFAPDYNKNGK